LTKLLLFVQAGAWGGFAVFPAETLDPAGRIHQLLLAGEKRVAT